MRPVQRSITTSFIVIVLLASVVILTIVYLSFYQNQKQKLSGINSFEDCAKHYPIMESYPEQCNTPDGKHFTRQLTEEEKQKLVNPEEPLKDDHLVEGNNTYRNFNYGFEFKFPGNWGYKVTNIDDTTLLTFGELSDLNHVGEKVSPALKQMVILEIKPLKPGQSIEDSKNLTNENQPVWEDIKVGNLNAKKVTHNACQGPCAEVIFSDGKETFSFRIINADNPQYQAYLNDITSTFRFLE